MRELQDMVERKGQEEEDDDDDWLAAASKKKEGEEQRRRAKKELEQLKHKQQRMEDLKRRRKSVQRTQVAKIESEFDELFKDLKEVKDAVKRELERVNGAQGEQFDEQDEEIIVQEYFSDEEEELEEELGKEKLYVDIMKLFRYTIYVFLGEEAEDYSLRIFYCSRTHSQLTQFVKEIQKSPFAEDVRVVSLASRQNMCINEGVRALKVTSLVNEKCFEMQKNKGSKSKAEKGEGNRKKKKSGSCPYYNQGNVAILRDQVKNQLNNFV